MLKIRQPFCVTLAGGADDPVDVIVKHYDYVIFVVLGIIVIAICTCVLVIACILVCYRMYFSKSSLNHGQAANPNPAQTPGEVELSQSSSSISPPSPPAPTRGPPITPAQTPSEEELSQSSSPNSPPSPSAPTRGPPITTAQIPSEAALSPSSSLSSPQPPQEYTHVETAL